MMGFVGGWNVVGKKRPAHVTARRGRTVSTMAETAVKPSMWGDGTDGAECPPADTPFAKKYGDLRGATIPTVTDTMAKFNEKFSRPVPALYRSIVNEMITLLHLTTVCAMWKYDAVFAFGYKGTVDRFFSFYPNMEEREKLIAAIISSLEGLDLAKIKSDAAATDEYLENKTEDEILAALEAGESEGPVLEAFQHIKNSEYYDWYYSRFFGFGVVFMIEKLGGELTEANMERWATAISVSPTKLKDEMGVYLSALERLKQAEQMFADIAARDKKKVADAAQAEAEAALKEAQDAAFDTPPAAATESKAE